MRRQFSKPISPCRGDDPLGTGLLLSIPVLSEALRPSPPVSTESIDSVDHSSGVDSPLHLSGDIAAVYSSLGIALVQVYDRIYSFFIATVTPPPRLTPELDRLDSSASASRLYSSTRSLARSDSTPSLRGGGMANERLKKIRAGVKVLDTVSV